MKAILTLILVAGAGVGGYFLWKNKGDLNKTGEDIKKTADDIKKDVNQVVDQNTGYPDAKTPKEAADLFRKAIKERKYDTAARYCTDKYAEILRKGSNGGSKLGEAIDNVAYQMTQRGVMTDEMKQVLFALDPFPTDLSITVSNETDKDAVATINLGGPKLTGGSQEYTTWRVDPLMFGTLYTGLPPRVKIVKSGELWKLDFPTPPALQTTVTRLNDKNRLYVQKLEILTREIKNEADTKENVKRRMKELLEDAAKE